MSGVVREDLLGRGGGVKACRKRDKEPRARCVLLAGGQRAPSPGWVCLAHSRVDCGQWQAVGLGSRHGPTWNFRVLPPTENLTVFLRPSFSPVCPLLAWAPWRHGHTAIIFHIPSSKFQAWEKGGEFSFYDNSAPFFFLRPRVLMKDYLLFF